MFHHGVRRSERPLVNGGRANRFLHCVVGGNGESERLLGVPELGPAEAAPGAQLWPAVVDRCGQSGCKSVKRFPRGGAEQVAPRAICEAAPPRHEH
jgi:hypothetical protein